MRKTIYILASLAFCVFLFTSCGESHQITETTDASKQDSINKKNAEMQSKVDEFALYKLTCDISHLSANQKEMIKKLLEVAKIMDEIFWVEAYGDKKELFAKITDPATQKFMEINYGPWDRLRDNNSFVDGFGIKPAGANFYPADITKAEYDSLHVADSVSQYSMVTRDETGKLVVTPYHVYFKTQIDRSAQLINEAAELAEDEGFKKYLKLRANALLNDDYLASDLAWMEMKTNVIDFVVGPIENYEDALYGYRSAHSGQLLIKDMNWSKKLEKFAAFLPELQKQLPIEEKYKKDKIGADSDLNAYDVVYYGGDCNAGSKNIAINLPNDPRVHAKKGSRRLQLKNAMQAKFDKILLPISNMLMAEDIRKHVTFNAFFENVMFHEVAHGIGVKKVIGTNDDVDKYMKEHGTAMEEGKADILGLFIVTKLYEMGELTEGEVMDNYVTFMAGIFRSVRFGVASSHGKANMITFNYFQEAGAFTRDEATGTYRVDFDKMTVAMNSLSALIIKIQGDGDYAAADKLIQEKAVINETLQKDLDRIDAAGIPRDIIFEQGAAALGL